MRRRGFTLVELLVVIAIIALLVSILMPALGRARELAKRVQCQSNLSACGRSLEMYKNEFKDKMPKPWFQSAVDTIGMPTWQSFGAARRQVGDFNQNTSTQTISLPYFLNPNWNILGYLNPAEKQNVGLCLYMLVRQEGTDPKSFLCPSAENDREMSLEAIGSYALTSYQFKVALWRDLQNFQCGYNLSYSYHDPWNSFGAQEDSAVMADKSNAFESANMRYDATRLGGKTGGSLYPSRLFTNQQFAPLENADATWTDFEGTNVNHGNSRNHKTECGIVPLYAGATRRY